MCAREGGGEGERERWRCWKPAIHQDSGNNLASDNPAIERLELNVEVRLAGRAEGREVARQVCQHPPGALLRQVGAPRADARSQYLRLQHLR